MAYIGRSTDKISNIEILDNITFDGSSSYSITKSSVAFTPNSAQSLLISIDGVVQATNFTVSSSTIDFGVAIPSTSTCDFFLHYGTGVMTVPSDGSVTTAKLGNSAVDLTSKVTGTLPVANGGTGVTTASALANTGNLVLLNTVTTTDATTTNIDFDNTYINSTYNNYYVIGNVKPVSDSQSCRLRFSISGTFQTGASYYGVGKLDEGGTTLNDNDIDYIILTATNVGNASTEGASFVLNLNALPSTTSPSTAMWNSSCRNNSGLHGLNIGSGTANNVDAHDGIRFYMSSGNFASGTSITLYGVKQ